MINSGASCATVVVVVVSGVVDLGVGQAAAQNKTKSLVERAHEFGKGDASVPYDTWRLRALAGSGRCDRRRLKRDSARPLDLPVGF